MTDLGTRLQAARKAAGLSAYALADLLPDHINRSTLVNLETGRKKTADVYELSAIAKAVGCSLLYLVGDTEEPLLEDAYKRGYDQALADMRAWAATIARAVVTPELSEMITGDQLRAARKARGMSQSDLAEKVSNTGVKLSAMDISRVENEKRELTYLEHQAVKAVIGQ